MFAQPRSAVVCAALVAAALSAVTAAPASALSAKHRPAGVQRELQALVDAPGGPPGVIVTFEREGRRIVYRAGVADVVTRRGPSLGDAMRIASVAKAFSGAVALRLVDRGKLRLGDTVARLLPTLPAAWGRVTLRELLQHTSGIPDYSADPAFAKILIADPHHVFDSRRLLSFVATQPLLFKPGTRYRYSNSDNIAVALMAEAATGRSYESLLRSLVFCRLGLCDTSLPSGFRLPKPFLHGYAVSDTGVPEDVSTAFGASGAWASGGVVSTPEDLNTFIEEYGGPELLSRRVRRAQLTFVDGASEPAGPGRNAAGLAIFRYTTRCGVVFGHTGNTPGYTQFAAAAPDGERSMTFSVNEQITGKSNPVLLAKMRTVQEDVVCELLHS